MTTGFGVATETSGGGGDGGGSGTRPRKGMRNQALAGTITIDTNEVDVDFSLVSSEPHEVPLRNTRPPLGPNDVVFRLLYRHHEDDVEHTWIATHTKNNYPTCHNDDRVGFSGFQWL